jgi:hypothetical protein
MKYYMKMVIEMKPSVTTESDPRVIIDANSMEEAVEKAKERCHSVLKEINDKWETQLAISTFGEEHNENRYADEPVKIEVWDECEWSRDWKVSREAWKKRWEKDNDNL